MAFTEMMVRALLAVDKVHEECLGCGYAPGYVTIKQFTTLVKQLKDVEIEIKEVNVETKFLMGFVERTNGGKKCTIYVGKNAKPREKRVALAKELCQILCDTQADFSPNGLDTLERLCTNIYDIDAAENVAYRSEVVAENVVIEVLYPLQYRNEDHSLVKLGRATVEDIADHYNLPVILVQKALADPFHSQSQKFWEEAKRRLKTNLTGTDG
jgi:hypothetical protein